MSSSDKDSFGEFECVDDSSNSSSSSSSSSLSESQNSVKNESSNQQSADELSMANLRLDDQTSLKSTNSQLAADKPASVGDLTDETVFKLDWEARDGLIRLFNGYTRILFGKKIPIDSEGVLMKINASLYQTLIGLPLKLAATSSANVQQANGVTLDLDFKTRSLIIDGLATNQSLASVDGISAESKSTRIKANNDLILKLTKLPVTVIDDSPIDEDNPIDARLSNDGYLAAESKESQILALQEEVRKLKKGMLEVASSDRLEFEIELDGVSELLKSDMRVYCPNVFLAGVTWQTFFYVGFKACFGDDKHLLLCLSASDKKGAFKNWSLDLKYSFGLVNQRNPNESPFVSQIRQHQQFSEKQTSYVLSHFSVDKLRDERFCRDNKIKIKCLLQAGKATGTVHCNSLESK